MAHWRDGGIGNMEGSDDRPIEEWTLLEKLAAMGDMKTGMPMPAFLGGPGSWGDPLSALFREAFDEIQQLREGWGLAGFPTWQPIETAPVPPRDEFKHDQFRCLIQTKSGTVMEGFARWVQANGSNAATRRWCLRWYDAGGSWLGDAARYWMPLPAAKTPDLAENGGGA